MSTNKVKWIAKGFTFKEGETPNPVTPGDINVKESGNGLKMDHPGTQEFGTPVSAKVAVSYIRQLWDAVDGKGLKTLAQDTENALEGVRHYFLDFPEKEKLELEKTYAKVVNNAKLTQQWLVDLLDASAAITMDKNIILKTLSQDECQGMRFYLAMKNISSGEGEPSVKPGFVDPLTGGPLPTKLTLCTVGVSKEGKDLFYDFPEGRLQAKVGSPIPDVLDESLAGEYPFTSGKLCTKPFDDPDLTAYPLYKYAKTTKATH